LKNKSHNTFMNKKIRVAYVLGSPFPTFKAYGVTTRETINVLKNNLYTVRIFCPESKYIDNDFAKIISIVYNFHETLISKFFTFIGKHGTMKFNQLCWRIGLCLNLSGNLYKIRNYKPDLVWTRDPMVAFVIVKFIRRIPVILEVHDTSGSFFYKKLKKYNSRLRYCPINEMNSNFVKKFNPEIETTQAPMGIRKELLQNKNDSMEFLASLRKKNYKNIKVAYIGNFAPGNYSKGIQDLIDLAEYSQFNSLDYSVTLIGATKSEIIKFDLMNFSRKIDTKYLEIKPYVNHSEALVLMKNFDVLVLPTYRGSNYIGMPLKLLEYISAGRITVVANTPLYRNLFSKKFQPFFYTPESTESLIETIESAIKTKNLIGRITEGITFAENFTWDKRTTKIISAALKI